MKSLALAAIRFYQRVISPRKGFCCAYRGCTGGPSCSALGYRAIRRHGVWHGIGILRLRLQACGDVYRDALARRPPARARRWQSQAGECDCDCSGCDFDFKDAGKLCDCLSDLGSCEWPSKKNSADDEARRRRRRRNQPGGS